MTHTKPCEWTLTVDLQHEDAVKLLPVLTNQRYDFSWKTVFPDFGGSYVRLEMSTSWGHNLKDIAEILNTCDTDPCELKEKTKRKTK